MSHFNPNQHFDVENWRDQKIAQRTKDALAARDALCCKAFRIYARKKSKIRTRC